MCMHTVSSPEDATDRLPGGWIENIRNTLRIYRKNNNIPDIFAT